MTGRTQECRKLASKIFSAGLLFFSYLLGCCWSIFEWFWFPTSGWWPGAPAAAAPRAASQQGTLAWRLQTPNDQQRRNRWGAKLPEVFVHFIGKGFCCEGFLLASNWKWNYFCRYIKRGGTLLDKSSQGSVIIHCKVNSWQLLLGDTFFNTSTFIFTRTTQLNWFPSS